MSTFFEMLLKTRIGQEARSSIGRLWDEPTRSLGNRHSSEDRGDFIIPNRVIQTWENKVFGKRHWSSLQSLRARNPDINFVLMDAEERDSFMKSFADPEIREVYFRSLFPTMRADIFRYAYVWTHGGYYLDISMTWNLPISKLHGPQDRGFIGFEGNQALFLPKSPAFQRLATPHNLACIWGFGFTPQHNIPFLALSYIKENWRNFVDVTIDVPKSGIISLTGPVAFTNAIWSHLEQNSDSSLNQQPDDFHRQGSVHRGAGYRHLQFPSYAHVRNQKLLTKPA